MNEIKIGVAGLGHRGQWWIQLLQRIPGYRITALYDYIKPIHDTARAAIPYGTDVKSFYDWNDFLAFKGMDAVALVVRSPRQGKMAAEAMLAGKHVNAEVPAAHSIEDCWSLVLAQEKSKKVYQLAEQCRFGGVFDAWRDLVRRGDLGHVAYAEGQYIGYYGTRQFFQNPKTGSFHTVEELKANPEAKPTWLHEQPPIHYVVHDLSPLLKVLDDRPISVTAMGTKRPSVSHPEIGQPDMQVALVKTAKDTVLRLATSFMLHGPEDDHHWWQIMGTRGRVEWRRKRSEKPKMWLSGKQMHELSDIDWRFERSDAPDLARRSGHSDLDYYGQASFRDAVREGKPVEVDAYGGADIAATGILAADSIDQGSKLLTLPDFRPGKQRRAGAAPK